MSVRAIVGAQWGDEGKGKITDLLAQEADLVIRFGGGANAGHTVVNEHGEFKLHLVPSGIFNPRATCLIGTGSVVDFAALHQELSLLSDAGLPYSNLKISDRAHVVMPYHYDLDRLGDEARGEIAIGTTRKGVGPAYVDKANRVGIQAGELLDYDLLQTKVQALVVQKNRDMESWYHAPPIDASGVLRQLGEWRDEFAGCLVNHVDLVHDSLSEGGSILLEGQLGAMRDLDWGTYPYVTSSTTISGGGAVGGGVPPANITQVLGVTKAYNTAVGSGPFPTELTGPEAGALRDRGREYGATTGRPRRVGWFDAVAARYSCRVNGFTGLAVTKLDVLDHESKLKVCVGYRLDDELLTSVPITARLARVVPVYEEMDGWDQTTADARHLNELPTQARDYLDRLAELVECRVELVSVGPHRDQTITVE